MTDGRGAARRAGAPLLDWLADGAAGATRRSSMGDFNAEPAEPAYARMRDGRVPVRLSRGERRRAGGDLAVRAPGAGDGHRRRARLPRLHLGPRRDPRRVVRGSPSTGRRSGDPTLYPSRPPRPRRPPRDRVVADRASARREPSGSPTAATGGARPENTLAAFHGRARDPGLRRARVRRPRCRGRRGRLLHDETLERVHGHRSPRRRPDGGRARDASASRRSPTCSTRSRGGRSSTSS